MTGLPELLQRLWLGMIEQLSMASWQPTAGLLIWVYPLTQFSISAPHAWCLRSWLAGRTVSLTLTLSNRRYLCFSNFKSKVGITLLYLQHPRCICIAQANTILHDCYIVKLSLQFRRLTRLSKSVPLSE